MVIHAVYENGVFRPIDPVELPEGRRVDVFVPVTSPDHDSTTETGANAKGAAAAESRLLEEINQGLSEADWNRYHALIAQRQCESLDIAELEELTSLADRIEQLNAKRMDRLAELARLRNKRLPELMDELGITAPAVL